MDLNLKYIVLVVIFAVVVYLIVQIVKDDDTENMHLGTYIQLDASRPVPYNTWLYHPLTFWNGCERCPRSEPYYLSLEKYYGDTL